MCARVARTCGGRRLKSTEAERTTGGGAGMKERGGEEWERQPLAVPPDWFELGTPAGIQARTSCRGVWVCACVRTRRGGKGGGQTNQRERGMDGDKEAESSYLPAVPHPLVVRAAQ